MKYLLLLPCLFLFGCNDVTAMTSQEIIQATQECRDANMSILTHMNGLGEIRTIQCKPNND